VRNRPIELLILFLIAVYVLSFFAPHLFAALGGFAHILLVAILILILVRLFQGRSLC
jgi:hypothetical protein